MRHRIKAAAIALALLFGAIPLAVIVTILASPFWSWFEGFFGIEAYGHSGPAQWCYLVSYGLFIAIGVFIWVWSGKPSKKLHG